MKATQDREAKQSDDYDFFCKKSPKAMMAIGHLARLERIDLLKKFQSQVKKKERRSILEKVLDVFYVEKKECGLDSEETATLKNISLDLANCEEKKEEFEEEELCRLAACLANLSDERLERLKKISNDAQVAMDKDMKDHLSIPVFPDSLNKTGRIYLDLRGMQLNRRARDTLPSFFGHRDNCRLVVVDLASTGIDSPLFITLLHNLSVLQELLSLNLSHNPSLDDQAATALLTKFDTKPKSFPNLESLNLTSTSVSETMREKISDRLTARGEARRSSLRNKHDAQLPSGDPGLTVSQDGADAPHPLRVLSLDGGGVRGLMTVQILRAMEHNLEVPINQHFDVIVGTSTGGLLAAALRMGLTLDQIERLYFQVAETIFNVPGVYNPYRYILGLGRFMRCIVAGGWYSTGKLESLIKQSLPSRHVPLAQLYTDGHRTAPFAVVTHNLDTENPTILANFDVQGGSGASGATLLEAVRATSAAPSYFTSQKIGNHQYVDGGLQCNNPSRIYYHTDPNMRSRRVVMVSVGTGKPSDRGVQAGWWWARIGRAILNAATNSEVAHEDVEEFFSRRDDCAYFRLNCGEVNDFFPGDLPLDLSDPVLLHQMCRVASNYAGSPAVQLVLRAIANPDITTV